MSLFIEAIPTTQSQYECCPMYLSIIEGPCLYSGTICVRNSKSEIAGRQHKESRNGGGQVGT